MASLLRVWGMERDATGSGCVRLVVGYAWDGGRPAGAVSGLAEDWFRSCGETLWDAPGVARMASTRSAPDGSGWDKSAGCLLRHVAVRGLAYAGYTHGLTRRGGTSVSPEVGRTSAVSCGCRGYARTQGARDGKYSMRWDAVWLATTATQPAALGQSPRSLPLVVAPCHGGYRRRSARCACRPYAEKQSRV